MHPTLIWNNNSGNNIHDNHWENRRTNGKSNKSQTYNRWINPEIVGQTTQYASHHSFIIRSRQSLIHVNPPFKGIYLPYNRLKEDLIFINHRIPTHKIPHVSLNVSLPLTEDQLQQRHFLYGID